MAAFGQPERHRWAASVVVLPLIALCLFLPGLGERDFLGDDEVLDAGIVRAMAVEGDRLAPDFNGEPMPKPPLFYALGALSASLAGAASPFAVRLPSALAGAATVVLTATLGAFLVGRRAALVAGLLLVVFPVFVDEARTGRADMTLALATTVALLVWLRDPLAPRRAVVFGALGLGLLAKGGVAPGLFVAVVLGEALVSGAAVIRPLLHPAALLAVFPFGAWLAAGAAISGAPFLRLHLLDESLLQFLSTRVGAETSRGWLHSLAHFRNLFAITAPWGLLLPFAGVRFLRRRTIAVAGEEARASTEREGRHAREALLGEGAPEEDDRRAGGAAAPRGSGGARPSTERPGGTTDGPARIARALLAGLVFFTLASRKSPYYLLPLAPLAALLVGAWLVERLWPVDRTRPPSAAGFAAGFTLAAVAVALVFGSPAVLSGMRETVALAIAFRESPLALATAGLLVAAAAGAIFAGILARRWEVAAAALWAGLFVGFLVAGRVESVIARDVTLRPFARSVAAIVGDDPHVYYFAETTRAITFYAGRDIATLPAGAPPPAERFWLVVRPPRDRDVPPEWLRNARVAAGAEGRGATREIQPVRLLRISTGE